MIRPKFIIVLLFGLILSGCGSSTGNQFAEAEPAEPVTQEQRLAYIARQFVPPVSDVFHKWAGSDSDRESKGFKLTLTSDKSVATIKYDLNENDYWSILFHQQEQTGTNFLDDRFQKYGNPWCQGYVVDTLAQLTYEFHKQMQYHPDWDIWPTKGVKIIINNYDIESKKDKYGNQLPDKVIDLRDAKFGITMSDLRKTIS